MKTLTPAHTPAPWKAERVSTGSRFNWIIQSTDVEISPMQSLRVVIEGLDFNIDAPFGYVKEETDEANARLIAAAPTLLAALGRLMRCPDLNIDSIEPESMEALRQASDALQLALGT